MMVIQDLLQGTKFIIYIGKKKKSGCIIECASGGEEAKSEDESDFEFEGEKLFSLVC